MTVAIVLDELTSWRTNIYFIRNVSKNVPHLNSKCSCFYGPSKNIIFKYNKTFIYTS